MSFLHSFNGSFNLHRRKHMTGCNFRTVAAGGLKLRECCTAETKINVNMTS